MITSEMLETAIFKTITKSSFHIPPDVHSAFEHAIGKENRSISKMALENTLKSLTCSIEKGNPACADTGWPLFYCKIGNEAKIEGGLVAVEETAKRMVAKASKEGVIRKTMRHPLTGFDPGNNIGVNVPNFTYRFVPGDWIQITFIPKGGGSELFGGTRYRVVAYSDGIKGIEKFIVDSYIAASRPGAICPPAVIGIGIGGTADISTKLAKEAATLRLIGSHHPEPDIADIGDLVYFSGESFTGRSRLQKYVFDEGHALPFSTGDRNLMIHVGPIIIRDGNQWKLNAFTPTSSIRFEKWGASTVIEWGLKAIVGKTTMRASTMRAMKEHFCIHVTPIGVIPNLYIDKKKIKDVYWYEELGSIEAAWILQLDKLGPFLVDIDTKGKNYFDELDGHIDANRKKAYQRLGITDDFKYTKLY